MSTARILVAALFALALAIGASSTANARSGYSFSISSGGPAWGYPAYPAPVYYAPPAPAYYLPPPPPPVVYPGRHCFGPAFSFSYHRR